MPWLNFPKKYVFEKESGELCNWNIKCAHHFHIMLLNWPPAVGQLMISIFIHLLSFLFIWSNACWVSKGNQYYDEKIQPWDFPAADKLFIVTTFSYDLLLKENVEMDIESFDNTIEQRQTIRRIVIWFIQLMIKIQWVKSIWLGTKDNSKYYGMFLLDFIV